MENVVFVIDFSKIEVSFSLSFGDSQGRAPRKTRFPGALKHRGSKKRKRRGHVLMVRQYVQRLPRVSRWRESVGSNCMVAMLSSDTDRGHTYAHTGTAGSLATQKKSKSRCAVRLTRRVGENPRGTTKRQAKLFPCRVNKMVFQTSGSGLAGKKKQLIGKQQLSISNLCEQPSGNDGPDIPHPHPSIRTTKSAPSLHLGV